MKKALILSIFIFFAQNIFGQIYPPYNLEAILIPQNTSPQTDSLLTLDEDSLIITDVEIIFVVSTVDITNVDSVFIKLSSTTSNILMESYLLPNNITNSDIPFQIYANTIHASLGVYSNLDNFTIECYLKDFNGNTSSIQTYPTPD